MDANGTSAYTFRNYTPSVSGKTGTVEAFYGGPLPQFKQKEVENSTFASYAPSDNPEIVVSVVAPYFSNGIPADFAAGITKQVYDAYFHQESSSSNTFKMLMDKPNKLIHKLQMHKYNKILKQQQ